MILHWYFARRFLFSLALVTGALGAFMSLVEIVELTRKFRGIDVELAQVLQIALLNFPIGINEILPLIVIVATIYLFVQLARSNELVVTRSAGRSGLQALLAPLVVATLIGLIAVTTLNPIASVTSARAERLMDLYLDGDVSVFSLSAEGLWMRQGSLDQQTVIHATNYLAETELYQNLTFLTYDGEGRAARRINAESAKLIAGAWLLTNAKVWDLNRAANPENTAREYATLELSSTLTAARIQETLGNPKAISFWHLNQTIARLDAAGFSTSRHRIWLQSELSRPLFLVAMVLLSAAFTMRHTRFGGVGRAIVLSILLGFGLHFVRNFTFILGENGQLPALIAAWVPSIAATLLALGLLLHTEDG